MPQESHVDLNIYNIKGEKVRDLYSGNLEQGYHSMRWDGKSNAGFELSSGIYIISLNHGDNTIINKSVKIK